VKYFLPLSRRNSFLFSFFVYFMYFIFSSDRYRMSMKYSRYYVMDGIVRLWKCEMDVFNSTVYCKYCKSQRNMKTSLLRESVSCFNLNWSRYTIELWVMKNITRAPTPRKRDADVIDLLRQLAPLRSRDMLQLNSRRTAKGIHRK